jgi:hypothetical protein
LLKSIYIKKEFIYKDILNFCNKIGLI